MNTDKNLSFEILYALDRISEEFLKEIVRLKKKLKFDEFKPEIRKCSQRFFEETLTPLFEAKEKITIYEIMEKTDKKKCTIQNYIGELCRNEYIKKSKNLKADKRTKLYEKMTQ